MMKRVVTVALLCLLMVSLAGAQEWAPDAYGATEYNCDVIDQMTSDFAADTYVLRGDTAYTIFDMLMPLASGCGSLEDADTEILWRETIRGWPFIMYDEDEYQCEVVRDVVAAYGSLDLQRRDDDLQSVFTYHQRKAPYCLPRYVIAARVTALLECPESKCELIGRMLRYEALPVVGVTTNGEEEWYEVAREFRHYLDADPQEDTAFVHVADVTPGPSGFVEVDGSYAITHEDHAPLCRIYPLRKDDAPFVHMTVIKAGEAYKDMEVGITVPLGERPAPIKQETAKTFSDSGKPLIHQLYDIGDLRLDVGIYFIDLKLDDITYRLGFQIEGTGIYQFHFYCN